VVRVFSVCACSSMRLYDVWMLLRARVLACVCERERGCVRACVRACACVQVESFDPRTGEWQVRDAVMGPAVVGAGDTRRIWDGRGHVGHVTDT
jgi:hypothetical protein